METIFPTATGYQGFFLVSFRKNPTAASQTQRVGSVLLKRTYSINSSSGVLTPSISPLPIFMTDQLDAGRTRYENDMAPFKPEADLIVLGFAGVVGQHQGVVNGTTYLARNLLVATEPDLFGWEPKVNDSFPHRRQNLAGKYSDQPADYPLQWPVVEPKRDPLPGGVGDPRAPAFDNRFYNGYRRDSAEAVNQPFAYLSANAQVQVQGPAPINYRFTLAGESVSASYFYYPGVGSDEECAWRKQPVTMNLDTLVIEPNANRCYAVWRGVWNFDTLPVDAYRRLVVEAN